MELKVTELDLTPLPNPDVVGRLVDEEAVLVLTTKAKVKVINDSAAFIWQHADGTRSIREIAALLSEEYAVELEQAQQDVLSFVKQLVQEEILILD